VPAQSGSNRLLKLMNRGYEVEEYLEFLARARAHLHQPEIGRPLEVSGDFIVGFPTETDEDFEATVSLVEKARYKNAFIFKYSPRPGTTAFDRLADDVPEAVKRARNNRLLAVQAAISQERGEAYAGREAEVMIEGFSAKERKRRGREQGACGTGGTIELTIGGRGRDAAEESISSETGEAQFSARTDTDMIVLLDQPASRATELVGTIRRVRITGASALTLTGELIG
jgi:tRNA-2-methylthio-N6-dimethylallyladenosine synthase